SASCRRFSAACRCGRRTSGRRPRGPGVPGRRSAPLPASCACLEFLFDPDELVQLRDPLASDRAGLDAEAPEGDGQMGDRVVRRLARPMRHDGHESGVMGQVHGRPRVGERPNLVRLNKDSVARMEFDSSTQALDVRHEDVVADDLTARPDTLRQLGERLEVLLVERILDAEKAVVAHEALDEIDLDASRGGRVAIMRLSLPDDCGGRAVQGGQNDEPNVFFHATAAAAAALADASEVAVAVLAPIFSKFGVPSISRRSRSRADWSATSRPFNRPAMEDRKIWIALSTPPLGHAGGSWAPVLAPLGAATRPTKVPDRISTSTVGFPRLSRIFRMTAPSIEGIPEPRDAQGPTARRELADRDI